jgi:aminoglycoside phosphotransferase (APT) family kinase protein
LPELEDRLAALLTRLDGVATTVDEMSRFHGGAARETWRLRAISTHGSRWLVMRRDPASSLIDTSRAAEFHALARAHAAGLPAPQPLHLDETGEDLGAPGFLMAEVCGGHACSPFEPDAYGAAAVETGKTLFAALGRLHALVPDERDRAALPRQDAAGRLAHWKAVVAAHRLRPEPIADAACRWLEANIPPPSGPEAIVHGDFRSGNFLVDEQNRLLAILDWEMAHIGDPMEDLAWAMDPLWGHGMEGVVAGTCSREAAISAWKAKSGRHFAHASWNWWRLFAGFQGLAIWISSSFEVAQGRTADPSMIFAGIYPYRVHNRMVARLLQELAA